MRHAKGHYIAVEEHTTILTDEDGAPDRHIGVVIDVTSRRQTEDALRESEQNLRRAVMASPYPTIIHADDGRIVLINDAFVQGSGYGRQELQTIEDWLERAYGDRKHLVRPVIKKLFEGAGVMADGDFTIRTKSGEERIWSFSSTPIGRGRDRRRLMLSTAVDLTERIRTQEHTELLTAELNHRVKNTLATVLSICRQTARHTRDFEAFMTSFEGRLHVLAQAHGLLSVGNWKGISMKSLVQSALEPFAGPGGSGISIAGSSIMVPARLALTLTLALHELATNAAKYGALSTAAGHVNVQWSISDVDVNPSQRRTPPLHERSAQPSSGMSRASDEVRHPLLKTRVLRLVWTEIHGPVVSPPTRQGFGSRLLHRTIQYEFGGDVQLEYDPAGVRCEIQVSLDGVRLKD